MVKKILFFVCTFFICIPTFAQERDSIYISQYVRDSFTRFGIPEAFITLTDENGILIDTLWTIDANASHRAKMWYMKVARRPQTLMVKAEHPDYETTIQRLELKSPARLDEYKFPELLMRRKMRETTMKEVNVTATRIQLAYKGDTIVVDAQAFKIPEGSMLDALVASVPGAELHADGTIYMNGRKVDYLTLNGKDFFKGKNRIMLDNLPYYVVSKLRFYEKDMPVSQMIRPLTGEKDYVMDVEIKQEYSIGYIANAEAGVGTGEKWLTRLFGLRFTDNSRILLFVNANNKNEIRPPGGGGFYDQSTIRTGEKEIKMVGGSLYVDDKNGHFKENLEASTNWTENRDETRISRETFLPHGQVHNRMQDITRNRDYGLDLSNQLEMKKMGLNFETKGNYNKHRGNGLSRSASFVSDPSAYGSCLQVLDSLFSTSVNPLLQGIHLNKVLNQDKYDSYGYSFNQKATWSKKLPWGDYLYLSVNGDYSKTSKDDFCLYTLTYPNTEQADNRQNRFTPHRHHDYSYKVESFYRLELFNYWNLTWAYDYTQQYNNTESSLYRLDRLDFDTEFGMLPSRADYFQTIDAGNSYQSLYMIKTHRNRFGIQHNHNGEKARIIFVLSAPIIRQHESVRYWRSNLRNDLQQHSWHVEPLVLFDYYSRKKRSMGLLNRIRFNYQSSVQTPNLVQMLNVEDSSDPLAIRKGNSGLKASRSHNIELTTETGGICPHCHIKIRMHFFENLVANGFTYNPTSGIYIYRPQNVSGNWNSESYIFYRIYLEKQKRFQLEGKTSFNYVHHVDLAQVEGFTTSQLSRVNHYLTSQNVKASYNKESLRLELGGDFAWNVAVQEWKNTGNINAFDFSYGLSGQYTFPGKIQLATDLKMYSRRGYGEVSMNTNELVWNASISRPFINGKLVVKVDAFDILNQLSNTRYTVNGQGRTEIWQLCMPRYAMLRVSYKFNKNPKTK